LETNSLPTPTDEVLAEGFISKLFENGIQDKKYKSHKQCGKNILEKYILADRQTR